jgi:two-component system NarL family sensor kinase
VAEHAAAHHVRVRLMQSRDALTLVIGDDGRGFDRDMAAAKSGLGLMSVDERVRAVGGRLAIATRPGGGTAIEVKVPVREGANAPRYGASRR